MMQAGGMTTEKYTCMHNRCSCGRKRTRSCPIHVLSFHGRRGALPRHAWSHPVWTVIATSCPCAGLRLGFLAAECAASLPHLYEAMAPLRSQLRTIILLASFVVASKRLYITPMPLQRK